MLAAVIFLFLGWRGNEVNRGDRFREIARSMGCCRGPFTSVGIVIRAGLRSIYRR
jgi:hypothetical protein